MLGIIGIAVFISLAWAMSDNKKAVRWRTVGLAFAIQAGIGAVVFGVPQGRAALAWLSGRVTDASNAESMSAAANIFVGQTEAPRLPICSYPKLHSGRP